MEKKVKLNLVGLDGNAFYLLGAFRSAARRQSWSEEEIDKALEEAKSGDYDNLLYTLLKYTEFPEEEE
jgi:hypothetical protein